MKKRFILTSSLSEFKKKALAWSRRFEHLAYYDNNEYSQNAYSRYECLLAAGAASIVSPKEGQGFNELKQIFQQHPNAWYFGYFGYDLKNELEVLHSNNGDALGFPNLYFFVPEHLILIRQGSKEVEIDALHPNDIWEAIMQEAPIEEQAPAQIPKIQHKMPKSDYLQKVKAIKQHIVEGDVYELNLCQEFFAEQCALEPFSLFARLNRLSPAPFAAFFRNGAQYLLCASPERFLFKAKQKLVSQPIKGTIKRGNSPEEDILLRQQLLDSEKDRAENVMIVDLVRNDLARCCDIGTVAAEELFGIYPFRQVFQMISTVSGQLSEQFSGLDALQAAFPMGSMTGAPKVMSMQLIELYELSRRGLYSGALGYFSPDGDFDFNVVIRSLLYQAERQYLSFQTGGAIVFDSDPEKEYEECLLKAKGMLLALGVI